MTPVTPRDRKIFIATCSVYGAIMLCLAMAFMRPRHGGWWSRQLAYTLYVPRWDLYTASPMGREERLFRVAGNGLAEVDMRPGTKQYLFGLDRTPKVLAQEVNVITRDTSLMRQALHYRITIPQGADPAHYVTPDTLNYLPVKRREITLLNGRYLIISHEPLTWEQVRRREHTAVQCDIVAIDITAP